ncbi:FecCD family ABC transporter permease [Paenibacillus sp. 481]|uniref:FecCD family ABC transporter permease n=1 Tax=Paenibacillus sp. 481 TaxID=2835869 RepID=UPI001E350E2A|nr:iron ABC transporter permease [Paenibacillus sp. 481]UHA75304.1 iron ABC transporter permease [Paenibacillus sp. 481]
MKQAWAKRRAAVFTVLTVGLTAIFFVSLMVGAVRLPLQEVYAALFGPEQASHLATQIVWNIRLPRILLGLCIGCALGIAGALLQGVMRNPLADPGLIGVSSGAGFAAVLITLAFPEWMHLVPLGAFIGAMISMLVIYVLAWREGASVLRIILAGVAVNAVLGAATSAVMTLYSERVQSALPWLMGGLASRSWVHVEMIMPYFVVGLVLSFWAGHKANLLMLGDDTAKLLGQNAEASRLFVIAVSALLAAAAVSAAGLIGFVGLVVPHIVRMIMGSNLKYLLPASALGGALLTVAADTVARTAFEPTEMPVGILLALLGGPFFLYLLRKGETIRG